MDLSKKVLALMEKHGISEKDVMKQKREKVTRDSEIDLDGMDIRGLVLLFGSKPSDAHLQNRGNWNEHEEWFIVWAEVETDDEYATRAIKSIINKRNALKQKETRLSKARAEYERLKKKFEGE